MCVRRAENNKLTCLLNYLITYLLTACSGS